MAICKKVKRTKMELKQCCQGLNARNFLTKVLGEDLGKKYLKWGKMKHSKDFDKFKKEILPDGRILYTFDNGSVAYSYEFTEI